MSKCAYSANVQNGLNTVHKFQPTADQEMFVEIILYA